MYCREGRNLGGVVVVAEKKNVEEEEGVYFESIAVRGEGNVVVMGGPGDGIEVGEKDGEVGTKSFEEV